MTKLGITLEDVPRTYGWHAIYHFSRNLPMDSALFRAKFPDEAAFATPLQHSAILADIADMVAWLKYDYDVSHSKGNAVIKKPKPYPSPWKHDDDEQQVGKGAIPISEFDAWYYGEE